jgi:hypothetical protein
LPPLLIAWMSDPSAAAPLAKVDERSIDGRAVELKSMIMVRAPVRIEAPRLGTKIAIPPALVTIDTGRLPYEAGESVPSQQPGAWLVGFSAPPAIGAIRPLGVTLEARLTLAAHTLVVHKGQCRNAKPKLDMNGPIVAEWGGEVGSRQVKIDCDAGDFDAQGRVWLLLDVRARGTQDAGGAGGAGGAGAVSWQIRDLGAALQAEVIAPPRPMVFDAPAPMKER